MMEISLSRLVMLSAIRSDWTSGYGKEGVAAFILLILVAATLFFLRTLFGLPSPQIRLAVWVITITIFWILFATGLGLWAKGPKAIIALIVVWTISVLGINKRY